MSILLSSPRASGARGPGRGIRPPSRPTGGFSVRLAKVSHALPAKRNQTAEVDVGARNPVGEMGHLRRLGGRWSALGGAWPDPKGPGRCLPTPWVPWVRAVPIGPLRWPGGRSRGPESAVLPSGAVAGIHPVRPCTCTMRPTHRTQVTELPVAGPHAPRGPTRSPGWAGGGCFGLQDAPWA